MNTRVRVWFVAIAAAAVFSASNAADLNNESLLAGCAVSAPNAKISAAGVYLNNTTGNAYGEIAGSVSAPLGCAFGAQIDGALSHIGGPLSGGAAAHLFYRNPDSGLLGVTGSYEPTGGVGTTRVGPELEAYLGSLSLEGWAGYAFTDSGAQDWFAAADAAIYPTDNLRLSAGWRHSFGTDVGVGRAELQIPDTSVSLFAEGQVGTQNYSSIKAGINVYLGAPKKPLIARHRSDDPRNRLFELLAAQVTGSSGGGGGATCANDAECPTGSVCNVGTGTCTGGEGAICGNGVVEAPEACDDGNTADGDGCNATCSAISCASASQCDDSDGASVDTCTAGVCIHTYPICGNGLVESPEECDDSNTANGDGCSATCTLET